MDAHPATNVRLRACVLECGGNPALRERHRFRVVLSFQTEPAFRKRCHSHRTLRPVGGSARFTQCVNYFGILTRRLKLNA